MLVSKINNNDEVNINLRKNPIQQVNEFCCIGSLILRIVTNQQLTKKEK